MEQFDDVKETFDSYVIANYGRLPIAFVRAEGSYIWDSEGARYVDLMPGWGTTTVGHCHPKVVTAIQRQAARLIHVDNTFYNLPQGRLARLISEKSFGGKCFFCNSGAEAVEAALKLARLHKQDEGRYKVVTMQNSFHGRTLMAITATGQEKYHKGYLPLVPGFRHVPLNDLDAVKAAVDDETCAVMCEPVQGEGGVQPATEEFVHGLRKLCDETGTLLIFDEVQTCMGRTGNWFGYQEYGVEPDIMTMAKALGGGVAIGAIEAKPAVAKSLKPGTHASTFGGNPLACAAAVAAFGVIEDEDLLAEGRRKSEWIFGRLREMASRFPMIKELRGRGMMIGIDLDRPGAPVFEHCLKEHVRLNCTHDTVVRMLPALNVPQDALERGLGVLKDAFEKAQNGEI